MIKLGEGNFGEVWKGKYKGQMDVAVKMLKLSVQAGPKEKEAFIVEAKTMHKFSHPKIVKIIGVCTQSWPMMIVTEFIENGSLSNYLRDSFSKRYSQSLTFDVLLKMMNQASFFSGFSNLTQKGQYARRTEYLLNSSFSSDNYAFYSLTSIIPWQKNS